MAVKGSSAQMNCTHKKDISFNQMYWYRQRQGQTMTLIVFTSSLSKPDYGDSDPNKFSADKTVPERGSLTVNNVESDDSAVYFCSVKQHTVKWTLAGVKQKQLPLIITVINRGRCDSTNVQPVHPFHILYWQVEFESSLRTMIQCTPSHHLTWSMFC